MTNPISNRPGSNIENSPNVNATKKFQPERYLEQRGGQPYLPLKWRLAWLRAEHPAASVETKLVSHKKSVAVFQAEIRLPGGGVATGWGAKRDPFAPEIENHEHNDTLGDYNLSYINEAENQALARALAVLGYGIEYATDFDRPAESEPIPLRDTGDSEADEDDGIEVPMTPADQDEEAAQPRVVGRIKTPALELSEESESDEDEDDEELDEDDEELEGTEKPIPSRPSRGAAEEPARYNTQPAPVSARRPEPVSPTARPNPARRPEPSSLETPAAPTGPGNTIGNAGVEERLKGISDSRQVLLIKQIFNEARRLYGLNEDTVDERSVSRYGLVVNQLSLDQANEYLERIKNSQRPPRK